MKAELRTLIEEQEGLIARRQLRTHGVDWDRVHHQIAAQRWVERTPRVISTTTGTLTRAQREWLAVLHAGSRSMLGGLSAAARHGLAGWDREEVTVTVDDELSFEPVEGVVFFRSRRPFDVLLSPKPGVPRCRLEPAVLLWAGYDATPRAAHGVVAAVVQQRLSTVVSMEQWLEQLRPLRRAGAFRSTLRDVAGGAHSGAELDVARLCRRHALPQPARQTPRTDSAGHRRWTDAEWLLADGRTLVLEVDGSFHTEVRQWHDDLRRSRRLTDDRRLVVRCSAYELRHESAELAADLRVLGLAGRVPDTAA